MQGVSNLVVKTGINLKVVAIYSIIQCALFVLLKGQCCSLTLNLAYGSAHSRACQCYILKVCIVLQQTASEAMFKLIQEFILYKTT